MLLCKKSRQKVSPKRYVLNKKKKKKSLHYPTASGQCETQGSKMSILMIEINFIFH